MSVVTHLRPLPDAGTLSMLKALDEYAIARRRFLKAIGCSVAHRDPLAVIAEQLVAAVKHGSPVAAPGADRRDICTADNQWLQVAHVLTEPEAEPVVVRCAEDVDAIALVCFDSSHRLDGIAFVPTSAVPAVALHLGALAGEVMGLRLVAHLVDRMLSPDEPLRRLGVEVWRPGDSERR
jgi:hypothetical protein